MYYFFEVGVVAALQGCRFRSKTPKCGEALETFVMHEQMSSSDYLSGEPLGDWLSTSGLDADCLIGDHTAIEVKARQTLRRRT